MRHAMIDVEALGGGDNGAVISLGACWFDPFGTDVGEPKFKVNMRFQDVLDRGGKVDGSTIRWWLEQSQEARGALFKPPPIDESTALEAFRGWYKEMKCQGIWGHGVNFDVRLLRAAYERHGQRPPWHYKEEFDTRTTFMLLKGLWQEDPEWPFNEKPHDALEDALVQVVAVQSAIRKLRERVK